MKKVTMQFIATYLSENVQYADENEKSALESALSEINAELNRGAEKAQANRDLYESAKDIVLSELSDTPVTVAELYESVADRLPSGFTKAKVQYALGHYWESEVVKHEGKVNSYTRA